MLSDSQFKILVACLQEGPCSQRSIQATTLLSLGTVNAALAEMRQAGYINGENVVTKEGLLALEPYKVRNAVIMAAGLSSRFAPISYEKPKGVLRVKGEVLIERQIRQLREAGIEDITIVVGYRKEEFFYLKDLLGVDIVINDDYAFRNNNSSIKKVADRLGNTFICSSDDYFVESPFEPYVFRSYYSAVYQEGPTEEYCLSLKGRQNEIVDVNIGGSDAWVMLGHVYWDRSFASRFLEILDVVYDRPATFGKLWEDIYLEHIPELPMVARLYQPGVIWEFDSLDELRQFDPDFIENVDSEIMDNICEVLGCRRSDIKGIRPISQGLTNLSCRFEVEGESYVYRHPGKGTDEIINRRAETFSQRIARDLGLDSTFIYEDEETGWKVSRFIEGCEEFDYLNPVHVEKAMEILRTLHGVSVISEFSFDLAENIRKIADLLEDEQKTSFCDFEYLQSLAKRASVVAEATGGAKVLCHNDFYAPNLLVKGDQMSLIDWEYSGMSDYASDLGTFICCCKDYSYEDAIDVLRTYFGREPSREETRHCVAAITLSSFYWFVWALYKDANGSPTGEWLYIWYEKTKEFGAHLE